MRTRKLDFILSKNSYSRYIFRFYPGSSHCHSFNDKPPKTYKDVYKVYFNYAIIHQYLDNGVIEEANQIWTTDCDECSILDEIAYICNKISSNIFSETKTDLEFGEHIFKYLDETFMPCGDGICWTIRRVKRYNHWDKNGEVLDEPEIFHNFEFLMTKRDGVSYIFELSPEKTKEFGKFLQNCSDYMLEHGEPI